MAKIRGTTQILAASISGAEIAANAVDSSHIVSGAIDGSHVAANAIDSSHITASSVDSSHLSFSFPNNTIWLETPAGTINGTNKVFTVATAPDAFNVMPMLNGVVLHRVAAATDNDAADEFFMTTGETLFTTGVAPSSGDLVIANYEVA